MRSVISFFVLLPLLATANAKGIELSLSRSSCQPGDVIELHASSNFEELATFELKLPQHEVLHLVAHQRQPVKYVAGTYQQQDVWVLQPKRSGVIEVKGIKAVVRRGESVAEHDLPVQTIEVLPYDTSPVDFKAEALPGERVADAQKVPVWLMLLLGAGGLVILFVALRPRATVVATQEASRPTLNDLKAALNGSEIPVELVEQLLGDDSLQMSTGLRVAMETAVYGQSGDRAALLTLVEKEVAR